MRLSLTTFITLDGVYQAPGGPTEDTSGGFTQGGWLAPYFDEQLGRFMTAVFEQADGIVLGRRTYDIFAAYWPEHDDPADPIAGALNRMPKYVASHTITSADWQNSTVLGGEVAAQVAELKQRPGRELQIHGSGALAQSLLDARLVDTVRLMVFPVVLGAGKRLFAEGRTPTAYRLSDIASTPTGVTIQTLEAVGEPGYGTVGE